MYKRQLEEQESISNSNIMRVKKFQRELESAESKSREVNEVEREVVVRKNVTNVSASSANVSRTAIQTSSSSAAEASSSSLQQQSSSSAAMAASSSSSRNYRAGSTFATSRAGSMARATSVRAGSIGRAGSMLRY